MEDYFRNLSLPHLLFLGLIPCCAAGLTWWTRPSDERARMVKIALGIALAINELVWYWYYVRQDWFLFPHTLPIQLCDILVWIAVAAALSSNQRTYELLYYWGLAGTSMALLTPDISSAPFSYLTVRFFASHGGIVIVLLFLTWRKLHRPTKGSQWRALFSLHVYAIAVAGFNYLLGTNYFYLCEKPAEASFLDYFGPWPIYILVADLLAVVLFWLLWLPFRDRAAKLTSTPPNGGTRTTPGSSKESV